MAIGAGEGEKIEISKERGKERKEGKEEGGGRFSASFCKLLFSRNDPAMAHHLRHPSGGDLR